MTGEVSPEAQESLAKWGASVEAAAGGREGDVAHGGGTMVLGVPVGSPEFENEMCEQIVLGNRTLLENIGLLPSLQVALLLLRYCAGPRLAYLMRSVPSVTSGTALSRHDGDIMGSFAKMFRIELAKVDVTQVKLPIRLGG